MNRKTALFQAEKLCSEKNLAVQSYFSTHTFEQMAKNPNFGKLLSDLEDVERFEVKQSAYRGAYVLTGSLGIAKISYWSHENETKTSFSDYGLPDHFAQEIDFMIFARGLFAMHPDSIARLYVNYNDISRDDSTYMETFNNFDSFSKWVENRYRYRYEDFSYPVGVRIGSSPRYHDAKFWYTVPFSSRGWVVVTSDSLHDSVVESFTLSRKILDTKSVKPLSWYST